jgi:hypothetical protein
VVLDWNCIFCRYAICAAFCFQKDLLEQVIPNAAKPIHTPMQYSFYANDNCVSFQDEELGKETTGDQNEQSLYHSAYHYFLATYFVDLCCFLQRFLVCLRFRRSY